MDEVHPMPQGIRSASVGCRCRKTVRSEVGRITRSVVGGGLLHSELSWFGPAHLLFLIHRKMCTEDDVSRGDPILQGERRRSFMVTFCPCCGTCQIRLFFRDGESKAAGYRCASCSCSFIILREGTIPEEDDRDHARDVWPY